MNKEELLQEIKECIFHCDLSGLATNVEKLLKVVKKDEACKELITLLNNNYTSFRAEATAKMMEVILRVNPAIGKLEFPDNYFYRLALIKGSYDLYECYIEEIINSLINDKTQEEIIECFIDLHTVADAYNETIFSKYSKVQKGMHFNGAFGRHESNENVVLVNSEDYNIMDDAVEKYNSIVGRRDILKDLLRRAELE
jgi:hypothetical protein